MRLVQLTDCHLGPGADYRLAGIETLRSFEAVIVNVGRLDIPPDRMIVTGDIAAHGAPEAYVNFLARMDAAGVPFTWLPGNHDDIDMVTRPGQPQRFLRVVALANWRIVSLVTAVPNRVGGGIAGEELKQLAQSLDDTGDNPALLFMHHPPVPVGSRWIDRQRVANSDELGALLSSYTNIRAVFTGHVHQQFNGTFAGIPLHTTPSTCFQFAPGREEFTLDTLPPAYRYIDLEDDGTYSTDVVFIADSGQKVDTSVQGY